MRIGERRIVHCPSICGIAYPELTVRAIPPANARSSGACLWVRVACAGIRSVHRISGCLIYPNRDVAWRTSAVAPCLSIRSVLLEKVSIGGKSSTAVHHNPLAASPRRGIGVGPRIDGRKKLIGPSNSRGYCIQPTRKIQPVEQIALATSGTIHARVAMSCCSSVPRTANGSSHASNRSSSGTRQS